MTSPRNRPAAAHARRRLPVIPAAPPASPSADASPPRRPTRARLQTYFLRRLELSGSVADAAARAGVTTRTVQRWRAANAAFARRYAAVLSSAWKYWRIWPCAARWAAITGRFSIAASSRLRRATQRRHADAPAGAL